MGCSIILLAGGSGKRMGTEKPKQFLEIAGKPLIQYSLEAIEGSEDIDSCVVVTASKDLDYMERQILSKADFTKVRALACGGKERYESVLNGLKKLEEISQIDRTQDVILIHDGARPFLTGEIIKRCRENAARFGACVAAVPAKDTVAIADEEGFESRIPLRKYVWQIQTPQAFLAREIFRAFEKLEAELHEEDALNRLLWVTDDAAVVEHYNGTRIRLVQGDYRNIKVTTPEDLKTAEGFLAENKGSWKK